MLYVKTPEEAQKIIADTVPKAPQCEQVPLSAALGRVLYADVSSPVCVPGFSRSTVDGYALIASDTFGCTDALPAVLTVAGQIPMGKPPEVCICSGQCAVIPTGGALPDGADAVQMLEYCEDYGDGTVGIVKPAAPGNHIIFRGDDASPGKPVLCKGRRLRPRDIGALAACGVGTVPVSRRPTVGILSTGDELVPVTQEPDVGQVRDVNSALLRSMMLSLGADARCLGVVADDERLLLAAVRDALFSCDMLLLSGGSSVGQKDAAARVLSAAGEVLFHGVAMRPGKPTLFGRVAGKPVFGLPGHPAAACMVAQILVRPAIARMLGTEIRDETLPAVLTENVSANGGRALYASVRLVRTEQGLLAYPLHGKSGLITTLAASDGYFCIPRDREGASAGETVAVTVWEETEVWRSDI